MSSVFSKCPLYTFCLSVALHAVVIVAAPKPETRAIWYTRFEWPDANRTVCQDKITTALNLMRDNNFNTVFFQVRGQCDTCFPSPNEPWMGSTFNYVDPGWDPLKYAINLAHQRGLEIHAYINTHALSSGVPSAAALPKHQYFLHGPTVALADSWLDRDINGVTPFSADEPYYWMSPGIPEASAWTRQQIMYIVRNYDIDGVHFDRIRTPGSSTPEEPPDYSYDPISLARFAGDGNPDHLTDYGDFMRSQITRDLRNIYGEIQSVKPWVKVSCSPFGIMLKDGTTSYTGTGTQAHYAWTQDGWGWLNSHVVDFCVPMIYWQIGSAHPFEKLLNDWMVHSGGRYVVAGSTTSNNTVSEMLAEHNQTTLQGAAGHCIFSMGSMSPYWTPFKTGPYDQPTTVAQMPWKTNPQTGTIVGHIRNESGEPMVDVTVNMSSDPYNYLSAYDGFFAILEVPTTHSVDVAVSRNCLASAAVSGVSVSPGSTSVVDFVLHDGRGRIALNKHQFAFGESVNVRVHDDDLAGAGSVNIAVRGSSESADETIALAETTSAGLFAGTIPMVFGSPVAGDGILQVAPNDTFTVSYSDANNGCGAATVTTDSAKAVAFSDIIVESVTTASTQQPTSIYEEFVAQPNAGWGFTSAKSSAPGLSAPRGRWIGDNGFHASAVYKPPIATAGFYDVYVTLPGSAGGNNYSPGAGFDIAHFGPTISGTFDLTKYNTALTNTWLKLATDVKMIPGVGGNTVKFTNNYTGSASSGGRFDMDAIRLVFKRQLAMQAATIDFDRECYRIGDTAHIILADADLIGSGTITVFVDATHDAQEPVLLSERGLSGVFYGDLPIVAGPLQTIDGKIAAGDGDSVVVSYLDENDGTGHSQTRTDTALVDERPPTVLNVTATNVTHSSARVIVTTDEPCTMTLRYGTVCGSPSGTLSQGTFDTMHAFDISGLIYNTTYSLTLSFADQADNLGSYPTADCYQLAIPDYVIPPKAQCWYPEDGQFGMPYPYVLWEPEPEATAYDVYFGTTNPPPFFATVTDYYDYPPTTSYGLYEPGHTYYWRVDTKNMKGVTTGDVWSFTIPPHTTDSFADYFDTSGHVFDLKYQQITFRPNGLDTLYSVCRAPASVFGTDPTGGTVLTLSDDDYKQVVLTGGKQVVLFGKSYGTVYVGSNGYITFDWGDSSLSRSFTNHFNQARVSGFLRDLNPSGTAKVSYKQLEDRLAVTYNAVAAYGTSNYNTFQIELFFDGDIRLTYLNMMSKDAIVGLSSGMLPLDCAPTDFSTYGACTPPDMPLNLRGIDVGQTFATLAWDDVTSETTYTLERNDGMGFVPVVSVPRNTTSCSDTGLAAEQAYTFRVQAVNSWGVSAYSNEYSTVTLAWPPVGALNLNAVCDASDDVCLSWNDPFPNEAQYILERRSGSNPFSVVQVFGPNAKTWTDTGVSSATEYFYRVRAWNTGGYSEYSNQAAVLIPLRFTSGLPGWQVTTSGSSGVSTSFDEANDALRATIGKSTKPRRIGWTSPAIPYTNANGNTIYRFKALVFRSGQQNPRNVNEVPGLRLSCGVGHAMNTTLDVKFHSNTQPTVASDMTPNLPSTDPNNPTEYHVDLDPVDVPSLTNGSLAGVGVHGGFEVVGIEYQENGSLELAEASISTYLPPPDTSGTLLKTYSTGTRDSGDFRYAVKSATTAKHTFPLPTINTLNKLGIIFDSQACRADDTALAGADFTVPNGAQRPRVKPGKLYQMKYHVASPIPAATNAQMALRARTLGVGWVQRYEIGGAFPTDDPADQALAQQALPGLGSQNPDKSGTEKPGILDGGNFVMYFSSPASIPTTQPGPGSLWPSRRDIVNGFELIDTTSKGANASLEKGCFVLDRVEIREFDEIPD